LTAPRFTLADALLSSVVLAWGVHFVVAKRVMAVIDPLAFALVRFALASALLLIVTTRGQRPNFSRRDWVRLGWLGLLCGANQVLWLRGLELTGAGDAALIMATSPAFVAIIRWAGGERPVALAACGFAIAMAGVGLIAAPQGPGGFQPLGDVLMLGAAVTWALYTASGPGLLSHHPALQVTTGAFVAATGVLIPTGLAPAVAAPWSQLTPMRWLEVGYSAFLAGSAAWVLWYRAVSQLGPTRVMVYQYFVPVVATFAASLWLGEVFGARQALGAALVVAGTLAVRLSLPVAGPLPSE
jgi:drug/metabolite transporter (DMT)-like permease